MGARPFQERRHPARPRNGDTKACPKCGEAGCEFNDHYRFDDIGVAPGWICACPPCRYREVVRAAQRRIGGRDLIRQSREVQARAKRQMMKCRSLSDRSRKRIAKSEARLKKRN